MTVLGPLRAEELAQGDILESLEFFRPKQGTYTDVVRIDGIVISHSCDFTKFRDAEQKGHEGLDRFPLLVAPLIPPDSIGDLGIVGHARSGRVARYFHLPPEDPVTEAFVDFYLIQPCAVHELLAAPRKASLSDEWQQRLQVALDRFFSRTATSGDGE